MCGILLCGVAWCCVMPGRSKSPRSVALLPRLFSFWADKSGKPLSFCLVWQAFFARTLARVEYTYNGLAVLLQAGPDWQWEHYYYKQVVTHSAGALGKINLLNITRIWKKKSDHFDVFNNYYMSLLYRNLYSLQLGSTILTLKFLF